jgi:hypothetical protein
LFRGPRWSIWIGRWRGWEIFSEGVGDGYGYGRGCMALWVEKRYRGWEMGNGYGKELVEFGMGDMHAVTIRYGFVITDCMAWERESIELFR